MPGFAPLGTIPVASLPVTGPTSNYFSIPGNFHFTGVNCYPNPRTNIPTNFVYQALTGSNIITPTGPRHVSWFGTEVLHGGTAFLHITWNGVEILHIGSSSLHVSWIGTEVLHIGLAYLHISQICVEVLRSVLSQDDAEVTHVY